MRPVVFAVPGALDTPTGGYAYDRRVMAELARLGWPIDPLALPAAFPAPAPADLAATRALFAAVPEASVLVVDGLAYGACPPEIIRAARAPIVALVHHPLACETGLAPERRVELERIERDALALARRVIVTSPATARLLAADYDVPAEHIVVAVPGVDRASRARGSGERHVRLLAVGALSPRKGYGVLIEALGRLTHLGWQLTIAGAVRDTAEARRLGNGIAEAGLGDRIHLAGALDDAALESAYDRADLFVMPSLFEGYGMVVGEALARGLPIVATTGGALGETVPDDAALKVAPGDSAALAAALARLLSDEAARAALAEAAWANAAHLPRWADTTQRFVTVLEGL